MLGALKNEIHKFLNKQGFALKKISKYEFAHQVEDDFVIDVSSYDRIQYGCGTKLLGG